MKSKLFLSAAIVGGLAMAGTVPASAANMNKSNMQSARHDADQQVINAVKTADHMKKDHELEGLLKKAKGVFLVPNFGRGAFIVGGRGGEGVLLVRNGHGGWSGPSFYNIGGISIGAQAGGSGGEIAFLLMTKNAVNQFKGDNNFSLNAGAGLSIVNYSANSQASWGKGDIIVWSNTSGAYAGATVSGTDINWDRAETRAYYGNRNLTQSAVFNGKLHTKADMQLQRALPSEM